MTLSDFQFALPPELIAQRPAAERDDARLLVLDRAARDHRHTRVRALPDQLRDGDLLVVNDTCVMPARIVGRSATGGTVELLLIRPAPQPGHGTAEWLCLGKPARRLHGGATLGFPDAVQGTVVETDASGRYTVSFTGTADFAAWLQRHGAVPLPPYIRRPDGPLLLDRIRYQTIFASTPGAVAAPTAGLHFTARLVRALRHRGVQIAPLTLHVGPGTFLPVRCQDFRHHTMDPEWCTIPETTAALIRRAKVEGGRVIAVGTTTTRALESRASATGVVQAGAGWADRFIVPGQPFRVIDALFTNFHLPGSPLLLLVSAFASRQAILAAYADAIRRRYRFYSYGDAMLIQ